MIELKGIGFIETFYNFTKRFIVFFVSSLFGIEYHIAVEKKHPHITPFIKSL